MESDQEFTSTCDSVCCYLEHVLLGGPGVNSRPLQVVWPHKIDAKAAILWSSSAKLPDSCTLCEIMSSNGLFKLRLGGLISLLSHLDAERQK